MARNEITSVRRPTFDLGNALVHQTLKCLVYIASSWFSSVLSQKHIEIKF